MDCGGLRERLRETADYWVRGPCSMVPAVRGAAIIRRVRMPNN